MEERSYFDGGLLSYIGWIILGSFITTCTVGTAMGLFGNWIKWLLLIIVTLGIYSFWVHIKLEQWKVKNTTFLN